MESTKTNKALLMIEFQNDWLDPTSALNPFMKDRIQFKDSITNSKKVLAYARKNNWHIIHAGYLFSEGYLELGDQNSGMWGLIKQTQTFQLGSKGSEYHPDFMPRDEEFEVSGRTGVSVFSGSNLDMYLRNNNIKEIFLAGYAMHACVESTFREAHDRGYTGTVILDASATFSKEIKENFLQNIVYAFGKQITTDELMSKND
ncbi:MAG: isochorismatase family cysteine hydrolase [Bacteroidota bacterium]